MTGLVASTALHTAVVVVLGLLIAAAIAIAAYHRAASPGRHRVRARARDIWHTPGWQPGELAAIAVRLAEDRVEITAPIITHHREVPRG